MNRKDLLSFDFNRSPVPSRPRSLFDHSHRHVTTCDGGYLIPIIVKPVFPGDTFSLSEKIIIRLNGPMKFPIMDTIKAETHYFYCRSQLLQDTFVKVMGEKDTIADVGPYNIMRLTHSNVSAVTHSIFDYMGHALGAKMEGFQFNAHPLHMYNMIWNDFYRDQDFDTPVNENFEDGAGDPIGHYSLLRRRKRKDMFTSARPYPQAASSEIPISGIGSLPVFGTGKALGLVESTATNPEERFGLINNSAYTLSAMTGAYNQPLGNVAVTGNYPSEDYALGVLTKNQLDSLTYDRTGLYADASTGMTINISSIRLAAAMQHVLELDNRAGHRYIESLLSQWGVVSSDHSMMRPEFLGGGMSFLDINSVPQSAPSASAFVGDLGAFAVGFQQNGGFHKSFEEHGFIIGLLSITTDLLYDQGMEHYWHWYDRWDIYCPELANLSEMPILNREIFVSGNTSGMDDRVFGYQQAWCQDRFSFNRVSGLFRSNPTSGSSLNAWHCGQVMSELPTLNSTFLQEDPPFDRIVQYPSLPHFYVDSFFDLKVARVMPVYSRPGLERF